MTDLILDDEKLMALEQAGLLKGRYYIVLEPVEDANEDEDSFTIRAYATKEFRGEDEDGNFVDPTYVILQGLLGAVHEHFDDVYEMGLERITLEALGEVVPEEDLKQEHKERIKGMEDNVIRVDFGGIQ